MHVPARPDLTDSDVYGRIEALRRQLAVRTVRAEGELVVFGDDVRLELAAFNRGQRLRFGVERNLEIPLLPFEAFPGLTEALQGMSVGGSREVTLTLPPSYPVVSLRGEVTSVQVTLLGAVSLALPDVSDERFLHACGVEDVDGLLRRTLSVLERERADDLWLEAQERVLDELIERARVRIPPALVDAALDRACDAVESGLEGAARDEARRAWREDAASRAVIERRLEEIHVLGAIAAAEGFEFDAGASAIVTAGFPGEPAADTELRARVLEYVLDRTRVEFERSEPDGFGSEP